MREFLENLRHFLSARLWAWPLLTGFLGIVASTVLHDVRHLRRRRLGPLPVAG